MASIVTFALAAAAHPAPAADPGFLSPAGVQAIAALLSAILWPAVVLFVVLAFRAQLAEAIGKVEEVELPGGIKAKIKRQLAEAGDAAAARAGLSEGPTRTELESAGVVQALAGRDAEPFIRRQAIDLAAEYERVRASMRASDERTRAMEKVMAKMRVIGSAAFPLRHELAVSASPGQRLQAIAILQVEPDDDYFDWLVDRLGAEKPFLGYHAAVALNTAANAPDAVRFLPALQRAAERSRNASYTLSLDSDREQAMELFRRRVAELGDADEPGTGSPSS